MSKPTCPDETGATTVALIVCGANIDPASFALHLGTSA